ncbi:tryptophan synthase subunit alpha [bacterium]|nr:MAG: tryptophan synthase subunit alpha [bacterium]
MSRLKNVFTGKKDGSIMSLYITAGFPEKTSTVNLVLEMEKAGADIIELGMPFSDPLADGPTIQYASDVAIKNGVDLDVIFDMVSEIRKSSRIPIVLMGYINPILYYGLEAFCKKAGESGADALIIPDVPIEESKELKAEAHKNGLDVIYLVAPNSKDERMKLVDTESSGFVYCVSVTGVTGARSGEEVAKSVSKFKDRVKASIQKNPIMIGFGIKSHDDAKQIAGDVDGFIVGSALIETIRSNYPNSDWKEKTLAFVKALKGN